LGAAIPRREIAATSKEDEMLFHVKHTHSWEACPYHDADRARETFGKAMAGIMESDVDLVGAYVDAGAHTTFLILDATSASQIEEALAPVIDIGWAETRPVVDFAEVMDRVNEGS
jgi:hypothetical protein